MSKHTQKNWLLIITGFLLISSGFILYFPIKEQLGLDTCTHNGVTYKVGDIISDSNESCFCSKRGKVECLPVGSMSNSLTDFDSTNLNFSYKFVNLLETDIDSKDIDITDISLLNSKLLIVLEKETLCTDDNVAPVSVGFYKYDQSVLTLTSMTNREEKYSKPCLVENTYEITSLESEVQESFKLQYQTEELDVVELDICVSGGRVFAEGDIFKSDDTTEICTCRNAKVVCGDSLD
jgi:hypothetical protein